MANHNISLQGRLITYRLAGDSEFFQGDGHCFNNPPQENRKTSRTWAEEQNRTHIPRTPHPIKSYQNHPQPRLGYTSPILPITSLKGSRAYLLKGTQEGTILRFPNQIADDEGTNADAHTLRGGIKPGCESPSIESEPDAVELTAVESSSVGLESLIFLPGDREQFWHTRNRIALRSAFPSENMERMLPIVSAGR